jgi:anti-sigma-K factor RskA
MTDELKEQAALFALGLLDEQERGDFLHALSRDGELAALVGEYHATMAVVALSPELREPPAALRESILAQATGLVTATVDSSLPEPIVLPGPSAQSMPVERSVLEDLPVAGWPATPMPAGPSRRRAMPHALPWLVAASFAIACGVLFFRVTALQEENARMAAEKGVEYLRIALLEPQAASLPGISARVAWNPGSGSGIIETAALPAQGVEKTYQLWIFEKDNPVPVSAGVFDPVVNSRIMFRPDRAVENAVTFAVSIEVAGGRPQPEGEVVLAGTLVGG